ncbi:MAG: hypothetical protein ACQESK_00780 [Bacteroidota bacterium]
MISHQYKTKHFILPVAKFLLVSLTLVVLVFWLDFKQADLIHIKSKWLEFGWLQWFFVTKLVLVFSALNWFFESLKWQELVSSRFEITLKKAVKEQLAAQSLAIFTPNRIGEFGAKALFYSPNKRSDILTFTFLGNLFQLLTTVFFGIFGLAFLVYHQVDIDYSNVLWFVFFTAILLLFLTLSRKKWKDLKWIQPIKKALCLPRKHTCKLALFSCLRYVVFSHQFYFLALVFGVDLPYETFMLLLFSTYFLASVIPSAFLLDMGIKAGIGSFLFSEFGVLPSLIIGITALLWIANAVLPAIIGNFFLWKLKWKGVVTSTKLLSA